MRLINVMSGLQSRPHPIEDGTSVRALLENTTLRAALGFGGNVEARDQDGNAIYGTIGCDVTAVQIVPRGNDKG